MSITEIQVEEAFKKGFADVVDLVDPDRMSSVQIGFRAGARWMQEKMFEQASEGFEEWHETKLKEMQKKFIAPAWMSFQGARNDTGKAWAAAKLSDAKEKEDLKHELGMTRKSLSIAYDDLQKMRDFTGVTLTSTGFHEHETKVHALEQKLAKACDHLQIMIDNSECRGDEDCDHCQAVLALKEVKRL